MYAIEVEGVSKKYGDRTVVDNVSFDLPERGTPFTRAREFLYGGALGPGRRAGSLVFRPSCGSIAMS
jgi:hypothetical protein